MSDERARRAAENVLTGFYTGDPLQRAERLIAAEYADLVRQRDRLASLRAAIADDALAITFQTFGQYRTALLELIDRP